MTKAKISEYSSTAADNTDIGGINIAEGMAPSDVNNALREQMAQLKEFLDGSSGDTITTAKVVADAAEVTLLNYCINGSALGNVGTLATTDMSAANFFSATAVADCTWAFTNPCTTGDFGGFVLELNAGGSYTQNWPASVDWPGGTAPTLSTEKDLLVFVTRDAGTTYHGMRASEDSQ